jgi:hypothetical protein
MAPPTGESTQAMQIRVKQYATLNFTHGTYLFGKQNKKLLFLTNIGTLFSKMLNRLL